LEKAIPIIASAIAAFSALLGVWLGSELKSSEALRLEKEKSVIELKESAFKSFLKGQTLLRQARQETNIARADELMERYQLLVKEAKFTVALTGRWSLITSMSKYFQAIEQPKADCGRHWKEDIEIYNEMRRDLLGDYRNDEEDKKLMYYLIFDCYPGDASNKTNATEP
jgi:hypothetical protein